MVAEPNPKRPFVENSHAPEVWANAASGFMNLGGAISITLESLRCEHSVEPAQINRVVIGRLVMPTVGAQNFAVDIFDFLKKHDLLPEGLKSGGGH